MEEREVIELLRHSPIMDEAKKYKKEEKKKKKKNVQSKNIINQIVYNQIVSKKNSQHFSQCSLLQKCIEYIYLKKTYLM